MDNTNQIIIYQSENGDTRIDVKFTAIQSGYHNNRWPSFIKPPEPMWWNI